MKTRAIVNIVEKSAHDLVVVSLVGDKIGKMIVWWDQEMGPHPMIDDIFDIEIRKQ